MLTPDDSAAALKNVGESRLALLNKLGIFTLRDLIGHYPRDYQDRSSPRSPADVTPCEVNTIMARLDREAENTGTYQKSVTTLKLDGLSLVWFNQPYLRKTFQKGATYLFTGLVTWRNGRLVMQSPDFERESEGESLSFGRIIPIYPSTGKLSQKLLRGLIHDALEQTAGQFPEILPAKVLEETRLCSRAFAISNIHFPENDESFFTARKRLVFEELFVMQAALFKMKGFVKLRSAFVLGNANYAPVEESLPFAFTGAQKRVMEEICADMASGFVMNRLVQGDVGSGKTAVAMAAAFLAATSGQQAQAALMAPTEVLARQHFASFAPVFERLGLSARLLCGALSAKEKRELKAEIAGGAVALVIGTHALIQENVSFFDLRLVIADEQHRFGVRQRLCLSRKGESPHMLIMSATPIPRTLALILYGDMDISIIDEMPPGRQSIHTVVVTGRYRSRYFQFIAKTAAAGRQAYVICPMIEQTEKADLNAVTAYVKDMRKALPGLRLACLHGKMKAEEKAGVMERFAAGELDVLVATTVIEVGINVPNAVVMVIENAERFGLSQLHQLRGRVGRGADKSTCVLVTDNRSDICRKRMKAMADTNDGFVIAELDLALRGPGEFFGTTQHGLPEMHMANLYRDMAVLKDAQRRAAKLLEEDPALEKPENAALSRHISALFEARLENFSL